MYHPETLAAAQRELEIVNLQEGVDRYYARQERKANAEGFERRDEVAKVIRGAVPIVAAGIKAWVDDASEKKRGRPHAALAALKEIDPDVVALAALSKTFHTVAKGLALSATAKAIGTVVQVELEAQMIQAKDAKAAKKFLALVEGEGSERATLRRHEALAEKLGVGLEWSQRTQVQVGAVILNVVLTALPDVFERGMTKDARGTTPVVNLTEKALSEIETMADAAAWLQPILKPMIAQPRPWTGYDSGAYLDPRLSKTVPLVRTFNREAQQLVREAIKDGSAAELLEGLNGIQDTAFAIDRRVFNVMQWVREENLQPSKSFPQADPIAKPEKMPAEEWALLSPEARVALSRKRRSIINIRKAAGINVAVLKIDLDEAERLLEVPSFYLPHSLDFRGRVYAVPHFNPQRSDHVKALFRFADTVPMGETGGRWLAIHLANCGDFGKVSNGTYQASLYVGSHRSTGGIYIDCFRADGSYSGGHSEMFSDRFNTGTRNLSADYERVVFNFTAPADTAFVIFYIMKMGTLPGLSDSYTWFLRPQLCKVRAGVTQPVPYTPGSGDAAQSALTARVAEEAQARSDADGALASRLSTVEASYVDMGAFNTANNARYGQTLAVDARVAAEEQARANADGALGSRIDSVTASYKADIANVQQDRYNQDQAVIAYADSKVQQEATARANADGAISSRVDTVEATANGAKASVQTQSEAIADLKGRTAARWSVTADNGTGRAQLSVVADGYGAGVDIVGDLRVRGDAIFDGEVTLRKLNRSTMLATSSGSAGGLYGDFGEPYGMRPVPNLVVDTAVGDSGTFYFLVNATQAMNTVAGNSPNPTYNSVQVCDTSNNVLADIKLPNAAAQQGGLMNYLIRTPNLWGARTVRWRLVTRTSADNYSYIQNPSVSFNWTAL